MALTSITRDFVTKAGVLVEGSLFASTSTGQTGTLQVNGGTAIAKNLVVGTTATIWGNSTLQGTLAVNGYSTLGMVTATVLTATSANIIGNETVGGNLQVTGLFTSTGAAQLGSTLAVTGNSLFSGAVNTFSGALFVTGTNIFTVGTGAANFGGTVGIVGVTSITNGTAATTAGLGSLVVTGGEYIGGNLVVMSTLVSTGTTSSNALYVAGGIGIEKGGLFGGPVTFRDTVTFNGTATYVLSTNTYFTDNIIEVHTPPGGVYSSWTVDDGKDIGLRFHYYGSGADQNAALVLNNSSKYLEWYGTGAEANNGVFTTATYGTFKTGAVKLVGGATNGGNTSTGDLTVLGGVGIGGATYIGGNINAASATVRNLTTTSGIIYSDASGNLVNSPVLWNSVTGRLQGTIDLANTSTNITGGAAGSIPYQTAASQTTMLPIGTNGYVLTVSGGNPSWASVSGLSAGLATTASNIAGGLANQIPYQTAPGQTAFNSGLLFNGTTFTATQIMAVSGNNATAATGNSGALMVIGGAGFSQDIWVGGNVNIVGKLNFSGAGADTISATTATLVNLVVTGTNSTNNTTTGAVQVAGGVGIGGGLYVGSAFTATGHITVEGVTSTGATGTGNIVFSASPTVTGTLTAANINASGYATISGGSTISALTVTNALTVGTILTVTGQSLLNGGASTTVMTATNTLPSLGSATAGAIQTLGGVGIAKDIYIGTTATIAGILLTTNTAPSLASATAGAIQTLGGVGIAKDIYIGTTATIAGILLPTNAAPSLASATAGAVQVTGGVGIAKDIYIGTTATVAGAIVATSVTPSLASTTTGALQVAGGVGIAKDIYVGTTATIAGSLVLSSTTPSLGSATAGVLQAAGGVGIAKDIYVGTTATVAGQLSVTQQTFLNGGTTTTNFTATSLTVSGNGTIGGTFQVTNATTLNSTLQVNNTTDSNATNAGSIVTTGGIGIAKSVTIGGSATIGVTSTSTVVPALYSNNSLYSSYTSGVIATSAIVNLDTYSGSSYRTAKYVVQIVDGTKIHIEEIMLFHDGTNAFLTEYAISTSTGELGSFDALYSGGTMTLTFTPNYTPTAMTIKLVRTAITA
jgi:hypothetical protein